MKIKKHILVPQCVRKIDGSFSFIPHRFVTAGFFNQLTHHELVLYFLLVIVGDRHGLSYYSQDNLCSMLKMSRDDFMSARNGLIEKSLIALDGFMFQVLSLPEKSVPPPFKTVTSAVDLAENDPRYFAG